MNLFFFFFCRQQMDKTTPYVCAWDNKFAKYKINVRQTTPHLCPYSPCPGGSCQTDRKFLSQHKRGSVPSPSRPSDAESAHLGAGVCTSLSLVPRPRRTHPLPSVSLGRHMQRSLHRGRRSSQVPVQCGSGREEDWGQ